MADPKTCTSNECQIRGACIRPTICIHPDRIADTYADFERWEARQAPASPPPARRGLTDAELAQRVRLLAGDSVNPLSVPCKLCGVTGGEACREVQSLASRIKTDGFHPLRATDAADVATRALLELFAGLAKST